MFTSESLQLKIYCVLGLRLLLKCTIFVFDTLTHNLHLLHHSLSLHSIACRSSSVDAIKTISSAYIYMLQTLLSSLIFNASKASTPLKLDHYLELVKFTPSQQHRHKHIKPSETPTNGSLGHKRNWKT